MGVSQSEANANPMGRMVSTFSLNISEVSGFKFLGPVDLCSSDNEESYDNSQKVYQEGGGGETGKNQATIIIIISQHLKLRRKPSNL